MDPLLTLLQSAFGDCLVVQQNMQASVATQSDVAGAIEARVKTEEEREAHRRRVAGISSPRARFPSSVQAIRVLDNKPEGESDA